MSEEPSVEGLLRQLRDEITTLIQDEVALVKTETRERAAVHGRNIGSLVAGALIGYAALAIILLVELALLRVEGTIG